MNSRVSEDTGQLLLSGMGELHLEIAVDRLKREWGISGLTLGRVQVAYRESPGDEEGLGCHTFEKALGGRSVKASIALKVSFREELALQGCNSWICRRLNDREEQEGDEFAEPCAVIPGANGNNSPSTLSPIPPPYLEAISGAIELGLGRGSILGFPVVGARVEIHGEGCMFSLDTPLAAVRAATARALSAALISSRPKLLEPLMAAEITLLEGPAVGEVLSDISTTRRGQIVEVGGISGKTVIKALVPLKEMVGYATSLRSRTSGEGSFSMEFSKYESVGEALQAKLVANPTLI